MIRPEDFHNRDANDTSSTADVPITVFTSADLANGTPARTQPPPIPAAKHASGGRHGAWRSLLVVAILFIVGILYFANRAASERAAVNRAREEARIEAERQRAEEAKRRTEERRQFEQDVRDSEAKLRSLDVAFGSYTLEDRIKLARVLSKTECKCAGKCGDLFSCKRKMQNCPERDKQVQEVLLSDFR